MNCDSHISGTEEAQAVNVALLPCPFCGEQEQLYPAYRMTQDGVLKEPPYAIDCLGCGTDFTPRDGMDARAAWNRRAAPALPQDVAATVAEWRKAMEGITPGPWSLFEYSKTPEIVHVHGPSTVVCDPDGICIPDRYNDRQFTEDAANMRYIVACSPDKIEALLALIISQSATIASAREVIDGLLKTLKAVEFRSYEPGEATDDEKTMRFEARPVVAAARAWTGC